VTARPLFTMDELVTVVGARLFTPLRAPREISAVATDSRQVVVGGLFVALKGERTDGHEYLAAVADAGAAAVLVAKDQAERRGEELAALAARHDLAVLVVADPLSGLQALGRFHMRRLPGVKRLGVTGSNGKTTTKEIIGSILSRTAATAMNEGNLNSEIGLPLACFGVNATHRYAVLEMGMNRAGEMDVLAEIVRPDLALITNIGTAHIGLLGSRDAIAAEKKKIFAHFDGRQTGFLPEADPYRAFLEQGVRGKIVSFGPKSLPGYGGSESRGLGGSIIHWEGSLIRFPLFGPHNLANALGAISVARELGVPNADLRDGLEAVAPLFGRSQVVEGSVTVIADCYNANPDSTDRAMDFLESLSWAGGRRIAVLGAMRELGEETGPAHEALGRRLRETGLDAVLLLGEEMESAWNAMEGSPVRGNAAWFVDIEKLAAHLTALAREGDIVLLKGSRSLEMERLLPRLTTGGVTC